MEEKCFSPEPCKSSGCDFTHGTALVLTLIKICTGEQMGKSIPKENSVNSAKPWAEFKGSQLLEGWMHSCVKKHLCQVSPGSFGGAFMGLGMHARLLPCRVKKVLVLCFVFPLVVLGKITILLN